MSSFGLDYTKPYKRPPSFAQCYACDNKATGVTFHDGKVKDACKRHADPKAKTVAHCIYCDTPTRKGSVKVDEDEAHRACLRNDLRRN